MGKLLLLILLAFAAYLLWKGLKRPPLNDDRRSKSEVSERMVTCAHCGLHLPESESVKDAERYFCSEDHRRLGA